MRKLFLSTFILLLLSSSLFGQKQIVSQPHGWIMYFGNHALTDKWGLHTEYQWRRSDGLRQWQQSLTRIGVDYKVKPDFIFTVGYGSIVTWPYGAQPVAFRFHENRLWEQVITSQKVGRFYLQHRYRLEQRWLDNIVNDGNGVGVKEGTIYRNRFRYRLLVNMPLNKPELSKGALFVSIYDEPFIQFGPNFSRNYLDQNRLYFALGHVFSPKGNIQLGYLNQFIVKADGLQAERNHTFQLAITYNLDFQQAEPSNP